MNDEELKQHESETLSRLQASEIHWHLVKAFLVSVCAIITIVVVIYYNNQTQAEVKKNRALIVCSLTALSPSNDGQTPKLINQCIRNNE